MINSFKELYAIYTGFVSIAEQQALDRNGQVINLGTTKPIVLEPDPYTGEFHEHRKDGDRSVIVNWGKGVYQSFIVVSQDILDDNRELLQPGFHARPILIEENDLKDVKIKIDLNKDDIVYIPTIAIQSVGCPIEAHNLFGGDEKIVNFGDATVNTHSLAIGVRNDQVTTFTFQGYSLELQGMGPKKIKIQLRQATL